MSDHSLFPTTLTLLNGVKHVTLNVPASTFGNPVLERELENLCAEYRRQGIEYALEIWGRSNVSNATDNACHKGIQGCTGCCPLNHKRCHCSHKESDGEKHVNFCRGGYPECQGCDPCGSPDCHYPSCNVYHDGTTVYLGDGETYDPWD